MSLHEEIVEAIHIELEKMGDAECLGPTSLAIAVQQRFNGREIEPHIKYTSLEHLKQMSRRILRGQFEPESEADSGQNEMFSGNLQDRYPIKVSKKEDPIYKLRAALSHDEAAWNIKRLRQSARARMEHADALQAWDDGRADLGKVDDIDQP